MSVLGGSFRDAYTLLCAFGGASAAVLARYVDEAQLECSSAVHSAGSVGVLLSMNGQQYARSGASYTYQAAASVSSISPTVALSEGDTPLTVLGGGFASASESLSMLTSRMGGEVRRAVCASASALVCNATRGAAGESRVEVSNNGSARLARETGPAMRMRESVRRAAEGCQLAATRVQPAPRASAADTCIARGGRAAHLRVIMRSETCQNTCIGQSV